MTFVDIATLLGMLLGTAALIFGLISSAGLDGLHYYWDEASVIITFGGAIASTVVQFTLSDLIEGVKSFIPAFKLSAFNTSEMIQNIIDLSNIARKEGLLSLEEAATEIEDEFLKKGILLVVDGTDPDLVRAILETELNCIDSRHKKRISFWEVLSAMGPAWGMIGTLIGLVIMLYNMDDPTGLGPAMGVALITTFYGSVLANYLCIPIAGKLSISNEAELMQKEIMVEGLLSIQAGENPRVIEEKLKSFLAPSERAKPEEDDAGGEE